MGKSETAVFDDVKDDGTKTTIDYHEAIPGMGTWVPPEDLKSAFADDKGKIDTTALQKYEDQVHAFELAQRTVDDTAASNNNPAPAENYALSFNSGGDMVSVNTGNANVKAMESRAAMNSTPPEILKSPAWDVPLYYVIGTGLGIFFLL